TEKTIEKLTKYFAKKYAPSTNVKDKDALLKMSKDSILEILKDAVLQDIKAHANSADTKVELTGKDNKKAKAKGVDILAYIY
ncbi:MAG: hypothetical protein N3D73_03245, partial [Candidatus Diapherotrites archaeon]|nr:hypothetical protein [Candidatus Diapherotrites archaeon]